MLRKNKMSLFCTSRCNLHCEECIMGALRKNRKRYCLSLEEIKNLIQISEKSQYRFFFTLSGGEPTLWPHLAEGTKMLRDSKICIGIEIFTNALNIDVFNEPLVDLLDIIRISQYSSNARNIKTLKDAYGKKIQIVDRTEFWSNPTEPMPDSLPTECLYGKSWHFDGQIYACAHSQSLIYTNPHNVQLSVPLEVGFLNKLEEIKEKQAPYVCTVCISNAKVRRQVAKLKNLSAHDTHISNL